MSTARLAAKLGSAGYDPNRLKDLERADLLVVLAETMLAEPTAESETDLIREAREASQILFPVGDLSNAASYGGSATFRPRELELEEKRAAREKRKAARNAVTQKLALKAEERRAARETKQKKTRVGV